MSSYEADARRIRPSLRRSLRGYRWRTRSFVLREILKRPRQAYFGVDERVAFTENHHLYPGMYGLVVWKGTASDAKGKIEFDLRVYDPAVGNPTVDSPVHRTTMEEIQ